MIQSAGRNSKPVSQRRAVHIILHLTGCASASQVPIQSEVRYYSVRNRAARPDCNSDAAVISSPGRTTFGFVAARRRTHERGEEVSEDLNWGRGEGS